MFLEVRDIVSSNILLSAGVCTSTSDGQAGVDEFFSNWRLQSRVTIRNTSNDNFVTFLCIP